MSDVFWQNFPATLIALGTFIGVIATAIIQVILAIKTGKVHTDLVKASADSKTHRAEEEVRLKVIGDATKATNLTTEIRHEENVKSLEDLKTVVDQTHVLVNNKMAMQLRFSADLAKRLSEKSDATEADKKAALVAEEAYQDHMARQNVVDESVVDARRLIPST